MPWALSKPRPSPPFPWWITPIHRHAWTLRSVPGSPAAIFLRRLHYPGSLFVFVLLAIALPRVIVCVGSAGDCIIQGHCLCLFCGDCITQGHCLCLFCGDCITQGYCLCWFCWRNTAVVVQWTRALHPEPSTTGGGSGERGGVSWRRSHRHVPRGRTGVAGWRDGEPMTRGSNPVRSRRKTVCECFLSQQCCADSLSVCRPTLVCIYSRILKMITYVRTLKIL